jgi:hypothetical protein
MRSFMAVSMKNDVHEVYRSFRVTYASIFRVEEYAYQDTRVKQVALLATYYTFDELHGVTSQKTIHEVYCLLGRDDVECNRPRLSNFRPLRGSFKP